MYNINFRKVQYKVNIHTVIRNILKLTKVYPVCQVKSNTQDEVNIPIVIMNNTEINESVFLWSRTI
jgi:hypothetical protein